MKNLKKIYASKQRENFEKETFFDGTTTTNREINYIFAPDGLIAIYENKNGIGKMFYTATDNLGSINMIVDGSTGQIVDDLSYDAWGRFRNPNDWTYNNISLSSITDRGYTGHEHMTAFSLINMNGRVYDPYTSQFLSPDPFVQDPANPQNYNRYSYVLNNPLKFTDPGGYQQSYYDPACGCFKQSGSGNNADGGWWYDDLNRYYGRGEYALSNWGGVEETANLLFDMGKTPKGLNRTDNGEIYASWWENEAYAVKGEDGYTTEIYLRTFNQALLFSNTRKRAKMYNEDVTKVKSIENRTTLISSPYENLDAGNSWTHIRWHLMEIDYKLDATTNKTGQAPLVLRVIADINPLVSLGHSYSIITTGQNIYGEKASKAQHVTYPLSAVLGFGVGTYILMDNYPSVLFGFIINEAAKKKKDE